MENGRLTTGTDTYTKGEHSIYTFITSNDKREIDDALLNRSKRVEVPRPEKELFLEILGLPKNHYLGYVYDKCPDFSIRQARQYLEDLEVLGEKIDEQALSQYINLGELEINTLDDLQKMREIDDENFEVHINDLQKCKIEIRTDLYESDAEAWNNFLSKHSKEYEFISEEEENYGELERKLYVVVPTLEKLKLLREEGVDFTGYAGWFEFEKEKEKMTDEDIVWAGNVEDKQGTKFGLVKNGLFKVVEKNEKTYIFLDSDTRSEIEKYERCQQNKEDIEIVSFDSFIDYKDFDELCFVKIDIEGNEENAVMGMLEFIKEKKPILMLELWEYNQQKVTDILKSFGYKRLHVFWFIEEKHKEYMDKMYQLYNSHGLVYDYK